jgi:Cytidylate kinase-like family
MCKSGKLRGRGAQCVLQSKVDLFQYAPLRVRIHRLRKRLQPGAQIEQRVRDVDAERAHYLKLRFGMEPTNPHRYDLLILVRRR